MVKEVGTVFNIQRFSVHDGPGIRTTVFMKGCNLNCLWCHNPESISSKTEIQFFSERCRMCGSCAEVCKVEAHTFEKYGHEFDRNKCIKCGKCVNACCFEAMAVVGYTASVDEIMEIVRKDKVFYQNSGGGMTVSGGEPLLQWGFVDNLLQKARQEGIHTAVDTALNVNNEVVKSAAQAADLFLVDIKSTDSDIHMKYTGVDNKRIMRNIETLLDLGCKMYIRCPIIKGVNDDIKNVKNIVEMLKGRENVIKVELLPYHNYGIQKAQSIGLNQMEFAAPDNDCLDKLKSVFINNKINLVG